MKRLSTFLILLFCAFLSIAAQRAIKVACVGNSITEGFGLQHPETDSYPVVLGRLLGKNYDVGNFGVSASTLLLKGDYPYMMRPAYARALAFEPDIVTIKLGTNDSKPQNWKFKKYFAKDLCTMIKAFRRLKSHPVIFLCYPATAYAVQWGINNEVIEHEMIPIINKVASRYKLKIIDTHLATAGMKEHFPDNIHPDIAGAKVLAQAIYNSLVTVQLPTE